MKRSTLKDYYRLAKPGIIYGNLFTTIGGFVLGSYGHMHIMLALATFLGISFIIGSACVVNNYLDRGIDSKMERTKKRALVTGSISGQSAFVFAAILGILGFGLLAVCTNTLTVLLGLIAYGVYVVWYGIEKRRSTLGTLVGSIAGALPPVAGYTAVSGHIDLAAISLFIILTVWQMPHFYAIAMYRLSDYKAAGLPVLPAVKGFQTTKVHILVYIIGFLICISLLTLFGYAGYMYLVVMMGLGIWWLIKAIQGFRVVDDIKWARQLFFQSLIIITTFSLILPLDVIIRYGLQIAW